MVRPMGRLVYVDHIIELDGRETVVLGRHRESDLQIDDRKASRQHCKVLREKGEWFLQDLDSANGTLLNGRPVRGRERLRHEDVIAIGASRIQVQLPEEAPAPVEPVKRSNAQQGVLGNPDTLVGRNLGGFILREMSGRSLLGATFRAEQPTIQRQASVTIIAPEALDGLATPEQALTALREQKTVTDPGLPERFDCGLDAELGLVWVAGAFITGDTVTSLAARGGIGVIESLLLVERIATVLSAIHDGGGAYGLLDGDAVILGNDGRVRLRDPGVAGALAAVAGPSFRGDPAFCAPEGKVDASGDLYALGCIFHLLLTGHTPYRAATPAALKAAHADNPIPSIASCHPKKGEALDHLLQGLLAKNPEWRYHTCAELLGELKPLRDAVVSIPAATPPRGAATSQAVIDRAEERRVQGQNRALRRNVVSAVVIVTLVVVGWHYLKPPVVPADGGLPSVTPPSSASGVTGTSASQGQSPTQAPNAAGVNTQPALTTAAADEAWAKLRADVEGFIKTSDHGAAELTATAALSGPLAATHKTGIERLVARVRRDGRAWYQEQLATLPEGSTVADLVAELKALVRLRDTALLSDRRDAASRYDDARQRLRQHLAGARREARLALEAGNPAELTTLGARTAAAFKGAPATSEMRAFLAQCRLAAGLAELYPNTTWAEMHLQMVEQPQTAALAAAAALLLIGEDAQAETLLARPELSKPPAVVEREALRGREAAVLSFDSPSDLRSIETIIGVPSMADGALSAPAGDPIALRCAVPIGGEDWEVGLTMQLGNAPNNQADLLLTCRQGDRQDASLRVSNDGVRIRIRGATGWIEQDGARPSGTPLRVGLRCRAGTLVISINGQEHCTVPNARIAADSQFGIDCTGAAWKLDDLLVVGG
jgi:pSer/pThr/pTyr-binding forkhead associated (FHA) protein